MPAPLRRDANVLKLVEVLNNSSHTANNAGQWIRIADEARGRQFLVARMPGLPMK